MPTVINYNTAPQGTLIKDINAGEFFYFPMSKTGQNDGLCVRVKDSAVGKGRFTNVQSGKLLTLSAGDRGQLVDVTINATFRD